MNRPHALPRGLSAALLLGALAVGCGGPPAGPPGRADLSAQLAQNPDDPEALRELGIAYLRERSYAKAAETLEQALARRQEDAKTLFYLGLTNEIVGKPDTALRLYERWSDVGSDSPYRKELRGRYTWLLRKQVRQEFRTALAREDSLSTGPGTGALGVIPFTFDGDREQFEPLGRGLAEMIAGDLASVEQLTVVERLRLSEVVGELQLAQQDAFDPSTAPRVGRLLRVDRVVGGRYAVRGQEARVDAALSSVAANALPELQTNTGAISDVFRLQKRIVFGLLGEMGITLSPAEQERIERVPTNNIQAFLAYARALNAEDSGDFATAADLFGSAQELDPGFTEAGARQEEAAAVRDAGGEAEDVLARALGAQAPRPEFDLVEYRTQILNGTLTDHLVPGVDTRDPAGEGAGSGILGMLPDPPQPPTRN